MGIQIHCKHNLVMLTHFHFMLNTDELKMFVINIFLCKKNYLLPSNYTLTKALAKRTRK